MRIGPGELGSLAREEGDDTFVLTERLTGEGGPVTREWLAVTDFGRRLSDDWLREVLEDYQEIAEETEQFIELERAFLTGSLRKELFVRQKTRDESTFDDTIGIPALDIEHVSIVKLDEYDLEAESERKRGDSRADGTTDSTDGESGD